MSYWTGEKIIKFPPKPSELWPSWDEVDCGCAMGLEWSAGYVPKECKRCGGSGFIFRHRKSGVTAQYPGGKFC